jgi:hypothetical protein
VEERLLFDRIALQSGNVTARHSELATIVETHLADADLTRREETTMTACNAAQGSLGQLFEQMPLYGFSRDERL